MTITNDDSRTLSINDTTVTEGNTGTTPAQLTITMSQAAGIPVTVAYSTKDGTATTANSDYVAQNTSVTFAVGETTKNITFAVNGDYNPEANEYFDVNISTASGVTISKNSGRVTITDDDNRTLTLVGLTTLEGDNPTKDINLTVNVTPSSSPIARTITYSTVNGSAIAGSDYVAVTNQSVVIAAGATSVNLPITIIGDLVNEPDETFTVTIASADGFNILGSPATVTITNDDSRTLSINDTTVTEGNIGTTTATLRISMSAVAGIPVTVAYLTQNGTATTADSDYVANTGTVTIPAGQLYQDVTFSVNGDYKPEANEYFDVNITTISGVTVSKNSGRVTINDDDNRTLTVGGTLSFNEGDVNQTINLTVNLTPSSSPVDRTIYYYTTAGSATAWNGTTGDFIAVTSTAVMIPANTTSVNLPITIIGDLVNESNETFSVTVTSSDGFNIVNSPATVTIINDDGTLSIVPSVELYEGNTSQMTTFPFSVTLSQPSASTIYVNYTTIDATATITDNDYQAASGQLIFAPGDLTKTINVTVIGDIKYEGQEYFDLNISNAQGVTITNPISKGYIDDDDGRAISINSLSVPEGDSGSKDQNMTVSLTMVAGTDAVINYTISSTTATAGVDFLAATGSVTIPAGSLNAQISVTYYGDLTYEPNENVQVAISTTSAGFVTPNNIGTLTLVNDDGTVSVGDVSMIEGNTGQKSVDVNVTLTDPFDVATTFNYTLQDGTAKLSDNDYISATGSVVIPAGQLYVSIPLLIVSDTKSEPDEVFYVTISNDQNVTIAKNTAAVTILNDDSDAVGIIDDYQREFSKRFQKNIYGDFRSTGAPIMCVVDSSGQCNWNYTGNLMDANTSFLNDTPSMGLTNSSAAKLNITMDPGDTILWAGLYWQGHIHSTNPTDIDTETGGFNNVLFRTPGGHDYNLTASAISGSDAIGYYKFRTATTGSNLGYRMFYQGFVDVTSEVNQSLISNPTDKTFSVAGIKATPGVDTSVGDPSSAWGGLTYGNFGGWSLIVVYQKGDKSNPNDLRNVSISDGYKFLIAPPGGTKSIDINISGFKTPKTGVIDSKLLFFGGLGEKNIHGDKMEILDRSGVFSVVSDAKNDPNNPFNDTISEKGVDLNTTRIYNPGIDLDTIDISSNIGQDQNKTTVQLSVSWISSTSDPNYNGSTNVTDQTFAGVVGFSTQLYQPQLCYDYTYRQNGIYLKTSDFNTTNLLQKPLITNVVGTGPIEAGIYLKNVESDFPIEGLSLFSDMNGTRIEYIAGSSEVASVNGAFYTPASESASCANYDTGTASTIACRFPTIDVSKNNVRIGLGREAVGYTKNTAGYLSSGDFVYSRFYLNPFAGLTTSGEDIGLKLNYFINLGDGEIPYEYTLGQNVKLCQPSGVYTPTLGQFNVIDSTSKVGGTAGANNLYTQVAKKPFDTDVAFYQSNGGLYNIPPSSDVNTTVMVEIIDADAYHDINASCANPSAAISSYPVFVNLHANTPNNTTQIATQGADYYNFATKNAAFRVWWFDDGNGVLIQNWHAYKDGGSESNVTGNDSDTINQVASISGLFNASIHGDCNATCSGANNTTLGCFTCMKQYYMHPTCSRDNFSIRPESYDLRIYDISQTSGIRLQSLSELSGHIPTFATSNELNLSAGYQYAFDINATNHTSDLRSTPGYTRYFSGANSDYNATMKWDSIKTLMECNDVNDTILSFNIINGAMIDSNQSNGQIGEYLLNIIDKAWTAVDWRDISHHTVASGFNMMNDCADTSSTTAIGNNVGCIITSDHTNGIEVYKNHDLRFKPYKFDLSTMVYGLGKTNTISAGQSGFVYDANLGEDRDMNMSLRSTTQIKAVGYSGSTLSNFVGGCYAQDLNITIGHNANLGLAVPYTSRIKVIDANGTEVSDSNKTTITASSMLGVANTSFSKYGAGVVSTAIRLNFDRNISAPLDPQVVQYTDFNVSCSMASECNVSADGLYNSKEIIGESAMDFNVTHVYGRVIAKDVRVFGKVPFDANQWYEVYNASTLAGVQLTPSKNGAKWYINKLHDEATDGNATVTLIQRGSSMSAPSILNRINPNGVVTYSFDSMDLGGYKAHIDTDAWLWYGVNSSTYSDPSQLLPQNIDCLTHPCFNITVVPAVGTSRSSKIGLEGHKDSKSTKKGGLIYDYSPALP